MCCPCLCCAAVVPHYSEQLLSAEPSSLAATDASDRSNVTAAMAALQLAYTNAELTSDYRSPRLRVQVNNVAIKFLP